MSENRTFAGQLFRLLERAELILLLVLIGSVAAHYSGISGAKTGIVLSLGGLGGIYFLMAYRPPAQQPDGAAKADLKKLFVQTVLPKLMWISCAVGAVALMMYHSGMEGYREMLQIHCATTIPGGLIVAALASQGVAGAQGLVPVLYRAGPLTLSSVYILTS